MGKKQKESFHKSKLKEQRILRLKSIKKEKRKQQNNSEFYKIYTALKKIFCAACLLIALLSSGCKDEGIIPPDEMASLLASFYQADAYVELAQEDVHGKDPFDSLRIYRPLLEERGYTDEDFRVALEYYLHNPKTLVKICEKARDQLEREADKGIPH